MPPKALLDSDTISLLARRHPKVVAAARAYEAAHGRYTISIMTRYEVLRGLRARDATTQLLQFEEFCRQNEVLDLTDDIVVSASHIYADLKRRGALIGYGDILIGATALVHGLALVTNNERHFSRINSLQVENWLK